MLDQLTTNCTATDALKGESQVKICRTSSRNKYAWKICDKILLNGMKSNGNNALKITTNPLYSVQGDEEKKNMTSY